jgi:DNA-binding HxlR family transcriptional regulator
VSPTGVRQYGLPYLRRARDPGRCSHRRLATLQDVLLICKLLLARRQQFGQNGSAVGKSYSQYCPVAHALDLVGERWSLLIARELLHGPLRYTDLAERLPGIGTNILAARLRELEAGGVVAKRKLPPPTPVTVYELTGFGRGLHRVLFELARWGARSLGPPDERFDAPAGWLEHALRLVVCPAAPAGRFVFRIGEEEASVVDGDARPGAVDEPDVIVTAEPSGFYHLFVDGRRTQSVTVEGDDEAFERLLAATAFEPEPVAAA